MDVGTVGLLRVLNLVHQIYIKAAGGDPVENAGRVRTASQKNVYSATNVQVLLKVLVSVLHSPAARMHGKTGHM